jgi:exportin-7
MTMAIPYMKGDVPSFLDTFIPQVREAFINARLDSVPTAVQDEDIASLFDEPDLGDQLTVLPALCRYKYDETLRFLRSRWDPLMRTYGESIAQLDQLTGPLPAGHQLQITLSVVENQLAILVYTIGTIIRGHMHVSRGEDPARAEIEAELCAHAFQLMALCDSRHTKQGAQFVQKSMYIELGIIYFLEWFRRAYVGSKDVHHYGNNAYVGNSRWCECSCL